MVNILSSSAVYGNPWCREELQPFFQDKTRVLIIPFAFRDDVNTSEKLKELYDSEYGRYYNFVVTPLLELGVKGQNITFLDYFDKNAEKALDEIAKSDVIYFTGGLPDKMVERVADYGIMEALKTYNGVVMGFSAGAMVQLEEYHITPDEDYPAYCECRGLGYVKQMDIEVHFVKSEAQRQGIDKAIWSFGHKVYAIAEDGLLLIQDGT
ncbi:MAG: Type 1 glutamine amidotransferase-like domain-containing protein [Lachnospiraceae bacterium]|nr:Type 1 glutamine amidotransferase-like domain-containing protein [Lachnospiraceae bacterium]